MKYLRGRMGMGVISVAVQVSSENAIIPVYSKRIVSLDGCFLSDFCWQAALWGG